MTKKKKDADTKLFTALFDRIAQKGLGKVRLTDLADDLNIDAADFVTRYPSVSAVIDAFCDYVDVQMLAALPGATGATSAKRDHYFDMIMARLDIFFRYRAGVVRWIHDSVRHPQLWGHMACRFDQSLSLMLDVAKDSPLFPVKKIGVAGIYLYALRAWMADESVDMGTTMAALDRALAKGEVVIDRFMRPNTTKTA
jgi:ubiquinone biosynthesis protein COQ9